MSILASLVDAYERRANRGDVPPFGYSLQKIGACIVLNEDGTMHGPPVYYGGGSVKDIKYRLISVPYYGGRSGIRPPPYFLWDNTAYVLGVTAKGISASERHVEFKRLHRELIGHAKCSGLRAVLSFLDKWSAESYRDCGFNDDILDRNLVFRLSSENLFVHQSPEAQLIWRNGMPRDTVGEGVCLITGRREAIARLHPPISGFENPARIVSFEGNAFSSYGNVDGANAPVSEAAAFAYTTVLNRFLEHGSRHRIQIGDAATVFWADAASAEAAATAEAVVNNFFSELPVADERMEANKVRAVLEKIRAGRPMEIAEAAPELAAGVRFCVLGLSPNAARLSVRFWLEDDFRHLAARFARHLQAMRIEPPPREDKLSLWRCLIETAAQRKSKNIPPNLAGEWLRAILNGAPYPLTLLATVLMRLRADKDVNALRVAILKAVLTTQPNAKEVPVSLDPANTDPGYLLGRLFAAYEYAQTQALPGLNATIRDKYYGTASATPRAVFPLLQRGATHHLAKLRKDKPGQSITIDRRIGEIFELADAGSLFVPTLTARRQALFAVGYYHQKNDFYRRRDEAAPAEEMPQ